MAEEKPKRGRGQQAQRRIDSTVIGTTGLKHSGGFLDEEFDPKLRGMRGMRVFREMADSDSSCGAIIFTFTALLRQVQWSVQAADDSPEAEALAEFTSDVLFNDMSVSFGAMIAEVCSMFTYGFAPMEIVWKIRNGPDQADPSRRSSYDDGAVGIRTIALRAQNTIPSWDIDPEDGSIRGMYQQPISGAQVHIPIEKMLLFRTTEEKNNPAGRSILRNAYRPWYFKKRIEELEAIGVERDLAGLPVFHIPGSYMSADADPEEKAVMQAYKRTIASIRRDTHEGLVLPSTRDQNGNLMFELKLLSTGGSRQFDTSKIVTRYDQAIVTSVLADFLLLGQKAVGSFALSSDKTDLFATALGAYLNSIADVFNRHLMPRLWRYNGFDRDLMPVLQPGDIEKQNLAELSAFIDSLVGAGAQLFPDRDLENHLRSLGGLPMAPEEGEDDFDPAAGEPPEDEEPEDA